MSSISGVSGSSNPWAALNAQRNNHQARVFAKVDSDGSGSVDQSELDTMLSTLSEKTGTTFDDTAKVLTQMDADGDGNLSSDELDAGMQRIMPAPPSTLNFAQARSASADIGSDEHFAQLDTDGDGSISLAEFQTARPPEPPATGGAGDPVGGPPPSAGAPPANDSTATSNTSYDPLDVNQDGVVSEMERLAGALKELAQSATDKASQGDSGQSVIAKLAQKLYDQINTHWLQSNLPTQSVDTSI